MGKISITTDSLLLKVKPIVKKDKDYMFSFDSEDNAMAYLAAVNQVLGLKKPILMNSIDPEKSKHASFTLNEKQKMLLLRAIHAAKPKHIFKQHLIKNIRGDIGNYFLSFLETITRDRQSPKNKPLRFSGAAGKKPITVKGSGIEDRRMRKAKYTQEEKQLYSKAQSTTLITEKLNSPLFKMCNDNCDVAFIFSAEESLLNDRNFIYSPGRGTYGRQYDAYTLKEAEEYHKKNVASRNPILFKDLGLLEKALLKFGNRKKFSEVMARIKWSENSSYVAVSSNSIESRWTAQYYAHILGEKVKQRARTLGEPLDDTYQPPIVFYLPEEKNHRTDYSPLEQALDKAEAERLYNDPKLRKKEYKNGRFQFLLCIDQDAETILKEEVEGRSVFAWLTANQRGYIADFLLQQASIDTLEALIKNLPTAVIPSLYRDILLSGRTEWLALLIKYHKGPLSQVITRNDKTDGSYITSLAAMGHWDCIQMLLEEYEKLKPHNLGVLFCAVQSNNAEMFRTLVDRGLLSDISIDYIDSEEKCNTMVHRAVLNNNSKILECLLTNKDTLKKDFLKVKNGAGFTPTALAAECGHWYLVKLMLPFFPLHKDNAEQYSIIFSKAVEDRQQNLVKDLIAQGYLNTPNIRRDAFTTLWLEVEKLRKLFLQSDGSIQAQGKVLVDALQEKIIEFTCSNATANTLDNSFSDSIKEIVTLAPNTSANTLGNILRSICGGLRRCHLLTENAYTNALKHPLLAPTKIERSALHIKAAFFKEVDKKTVKDNKPQSPADSLGNG
ncbi:MAG: ankyrin repeat domain-containing protein [Legionellaceae bacterium]|nr:ankyrin repeat domain-containing protein [Legionellaceae bacterium]